MFFRRSLHSNKSIRSLLANIGLSEFPDFMNYWAGGSCPALPNAMYELFILTLLDSEESISLGKHGPNPSMWYLKHGADSRLLIRMLSASFYSLGYFVPREFRL